MDGEFIYESQRMFLVWDYDFERASLLLRSSQDEKYKTTIDIIFLGVYYMELPSRITSLEIRESDVEDLLYFESKTGDYFAYSNHFVIFSNQTKHFISAGACAVYENDLPSHESFFRVDGSEGRYGTLIVQH